MWDQERSVRGRRRAVLAGIIGLVLYIGYVSVVGVALLAQAGIWSLFGCLSITALGAGVSTRLPWSTTVFTTLLVLTYGVLLAVGWSLAPTWQFGVLFVPVAGPLAGRCWSMVGT